MDVRPCGLAAPPGPHGMGLKPSQRGWFWPGLLAGAEGGMGWACGCVAWPHRRGLAGASRDGPQAFSAWVVSTKP
jgi:hypothetical protein